MANEDVALRGLAEAVDLTHNPNEMHERATANERLPLRPQDEMECRRCAVYCDKVVHPSACIEQACPFVYVYEERGRTYMGCMQKVFDVEIDLAVLAESHAERGGFGAVKACRRPLPMCRAEVLRCYESREDNLGCVNPEFYELPQGRPAFRVTVSAESRHADRSADA